MLLNERVEQTHFTWDFSGEVAVGGEFETAGILGGVVYNVNVPRLQRATDRKPARKTGVTFEVYDDQNVFPQLCNPSRQHTDPHYH